MLRLKDQQIHEMAHDTPVRTPVICIPKPNSVIGSAFHDSSIAVLSGALQRGPDHKPECGTAGDLDFSCNLEAVTLVKGDVGLVGRLEVCGHTSSVTVFKGCPEQGGGDPLALVLRFCAEYGQIPVRLRGVTLHCQLAESGGTEEGGLGTG